MASSFTKAALRGATSLTVFAVLGSTAAFAQATDAGTSTTAADEAPADTGAIIVTGSRIRSANLESTNPVTVVSGEQFFQTGQVSVGDVLNELPQLRNTFSQQNSTRFLGTRGLNLVDLRGLGTSRTLVLVNGRRHVAGDILSTGVSVDTNTIPTDLIQSVEVLTGGASAVYGSDAIAGVVNFKLKTDYEGVQVRGNAGISKYNDAGNQYISLLAGKNFADGRGNIALNLEFAHQSQYDATGRPLARNNGFVTTDTDPASAPSDGISDRQFFRDIRSGTISLGGLTAFRYGGATGPCGGGGGSAFTCNSLFAPGGGLIAQTGDRVGIGPTGAFIGGNGSTSREGQLLTFTPDLKRYSVNLLGHFEVSPAFVPFFEAKYVRTEAQGSQSGPFFSQGTTLGRFGSTAGAGTGASSIGGFAGGADRSFINGTYTTAGVPVNSGVNREGIRLDNPYLSATARATLAAQLTAAINSGVNPNTGIAFTSGGVTAEQAAANRDASLAQVAAGTYRFGLRRNWVDLGIRDEQIKRETYRAVIGVRGDFNEDWNYEVAVNYGEFREKNLIQGNINAQRFLLAQDTVRDASGTIRCRAQVDGRYGGTDVGGNPAQLASDIAACVPLNPFGQGSVSDAARNYLLVPSRASGKITQLDINAFVSGDSSQLFELPGGPIGFSVGGEYRRETNRYDLDDFTQAGYAFYNAIPSLTAPSFEVKEVYGELRVPILKDVPFFQELTLTGNGRIADYKGATGTVYAYGGGIDWRPIQDVRFRGTYSRSVRAPNLTELYSAQGQNFAPSFVDPCSARNIGTGSANRAANCAAAGVPTSYDYVYLSSLETVSGGNPLLGAEKSDSYTAGVVFTPTFVPGLSISVDYFDITVNNVIASVNAQQVANLCYDSSSLSNQFCSLFQRAGASGGPNGEQAFQILQGSLLESTANFAKLKARGIDTKIEYRHSFDWGQLNLGVNYTRTLQRDDFTNPDDPDFKDRILGELGDPKNEVNLNSSLKVGRVTFGYQLRWIDKMYLNTYEDYNELNGLPPQNTDFYSQAKYPDVFYHDLRLDYEVSDQYNLTLGIDNVGNKMPPFGLTGVGNGLNTAADGGAGIYDVRGRYMYAAFLAKF
ncbi:outer membrane receptor protein involved in Fe transport [Novosphingobium chloroacetimidivorans]|uniref:Outer membrane receptor protein involved in Fe transport n=1 Tax=Novosphingobium chloroacetimidivorans TaxID=1428314 RepID=A0A7W7NXC5_9SPHN|nr:TonB-dependent receptor [Novosphingobium chloroacetimidivorans]MBB4860256.1 outer membrane receptor protein involved in Fe transport [Novosphingobium chloroacetimidivorans]